MVNGVKIFGQNLSHNLSLIQLVVIESGNQRVDPLLAPSLKERNRTIISSRQSCGAKGDFVLRKRATPCDRDY